MVALHISTAFDAGPIKIISPVDSAYIWLSTPQDKASGIAGAHAARLKTMNHPNNTDQRLTELEIKTSFTEDLLEQLDQVVIRQQQQIDLLMREVAALRQPGAEVGAVAPRNLRDELPPHF
jgi:SlyX protein